MSPALTLDPNVITVIDGGTGTEIQRRGVPMDDRTWCAEANLIAPDVVRDVHRSYVEAGAQLLIANTFASSPFLFSHLDRLDELAGIDRRAVELAREAAEDRVPVAARCPRCVQVRPAAIAPISPASGRRAKPACCAA